MEAAVKKGDVKELAELMRQDPGFKVNMDHGFYFACFGRPSCVREMLKDSRVKVNEPKDNGCTPLWSAAVFGHLDVIKWWIASGREMDLGIPGDFKTDVTGVAKEEKRTEIATLLERFRRIQRKPGMR